MLDGADQDVGQNAKMLGEQSQGDAFAGARIAGKHAEAAIGDAELDTSNDAVDRGGGGFCHWPSPVSTGLEPW